MAQCAGHVVNVNYLHGFCVCKSAPRACEHGRHALTLCCTVQKAPPKSVMRARCEKENDKALILSFFVQSSSDAVRPARRGAKKDA